MNDVKFKLGITQKQTEQLIKYSKEDETIKTNTNDSVRFANKASFNKWRKIKRRVFTLTNTSGDLLGIVWFRPQELPSDKNFGVTFAIRIYGNARGKGLSKMFLEKSMDAYFKSKQYLNIKNKKVWLETNPVNQVAIKLYEKFGFKKTGEININGRIVMIR